ncbi:hypothetical protein EDD15DRAFT_2378268 [Pisolithus albus]|nr:hypothetical protein EDD15DRAFT_2378268 [Pisolithus albus]
MPTQSLTAALLVLGNTEGLPWSTPPWEAITHVHGLPWSTVEGASDDSPAPYVSGWTTRLASKVKAFAEKVWTLKKPDAQDSFVSTRKADNHSGGREAWSKFVRDNQGKWGINRIIDDVLFNAGRAPQQVMRDLDVQKLPSMEDAQIQDCLKPLAERLLGLASYVGTTSLLKQEVARFVRTLLTISWNRYRKSTNRDMTKIRNGTELVRESWIALTSEGAKPTIAQIRTFLKHLRPLVKLMAKYDDIATRTELQRYQAEMEAILAELNHDDSDPERSQRLPKAIRDALRNLASEEDVQAINRLVLASLENIREQDELDRVDLDLEAALPLEDWREGVEDLNKLSEDELWGKLGLPEKRLPFFQEWTDPDCMIDPWSEVGQVMGLLGWHP